MSSETFSSEQTSVSRLSRRSAMTSLAGLGAATFLPCQDLLAQGPIDFTPLQLNSDGQGLVNSTVSKLDQHEDELLDHLLSGDTQGEQSDLGILQNDFTTISVNPGIQISDQNIFQQELFGCRNSITLILQSGNFGWGSLQPCIKKIDFFVGHWYPCNDILEISACEYKIWHCLNRQPNPLLLHYYFQHLTYELVAICTYHGSSSSRFLAHRDQLFALGQRYSSDLQTQNYSACRTDFQRFTTATSLFFRRHYPQWC